MSTAVADRFASSSFGKGIFEPRAETAPLHASGGSRPRGEMTADQQQARAAQMRRALQAVCAAHNEVFRQLGDDAWSLF